MSYGNENTNKERAQVGVSDIFNTYLFIILRTHAWSLLCFRKFRKLQMHNVSYVSTNGRWQILYPAPYRHVETFFYKVAKQ